LENAQQQAAQAAAQQPATQPTSGEGSTGNLEKRAEIAKLATASDGSTDWAYASKSDHLPANTNKCSEFVDDTAARAGAPAKFDGRPALAGELRNPKAKIANWRPLSQAKSRSRAMLRQFGF